MNLLTLSSAKVFFSAISRKKVSGYDQRPGTLAAGEGRKDLSGRGPVVRKGFLCQCHQLLLLRRRASKIITKVFDLRSNADYEDYIQFEKQEVLTVRENVRDLLDEIAAYLSREWFK